MRAIFFGSPAFAVPCLNALHEIAEVVSVVCQPDRPAGRGLSLRPPAVKVRALELGLHVRQPTKVRTASFAVELRELGADVGVVVAYGRILPIAVLDAPRLRCVNVHASILPRWRGAAPIQWAIAAGDPMTGVSLMQMDEGMDTGPVLAVKETRIAPDETADALSERLAALGAKLLAERLPAYHRGELEAVPQRDADATKAPLLRKTDGAVDWSASSQQVHDRVRAMTSWPGAYTYQDNDRIKIFETGVYEGTFEGVAPGEVVLATQEGIVIACGDGAVVVRRLQQSGRKKLTAAQAVAGRQVRVGQRWHSAETDRT